MYSLDFITISKQCSGKVSHNRLVSTAPDQQRLLIMPVRIPAFLSSKSVSAAPGVMFHTDRGSQFTAKRFRQYLDQHNMIQSFSAKGYPYDHAVMDCFFRYLKHEETDRRFYSSLAELQDALFRYIHGFYNPNMFRPHIMLVCCAIFFPALGYTAVVMCNFSLANYHTRGIQFIFISFQIAEK